MIETIKEWMKAHETLFWWMAVVTVFSYVAVPFVIRAVVIRMSADHFLYRNPPPNSWRAQHPAVRIALLVLKNLLGWVLVAVGIVQSIPVLVPGFGLLTIMIGVLLLNFPGKRKLELKIVSASAVLRLINKIRQKHHRSPLRLPDHLPLRTDCD